MRTDVGTQTPLAGLAEKALVAVGAPFLLVGLGFIYLGVRVKERSQRA